MAKTIGIFLAGQAGDILTASSVLKYRHELWGDAKIVWYIEGRNRDLLAYHENLELRTFPRGFGYPDMCLEMNRRPNEPLWEDWAPLVDSENRLNLSLKTAFSSLADIDEGYFPAPHQLTTQQRHGLTYPEISRKVFGCEGREWHPYIKFSDNERIAAESCLYQARKSGRRVIAIETFAGSGQSKMDDEQVRKAMQICVDIWGKCSFVFMSHKYINGNEIFPDDLNKTFPFSIHTERNIFFGSGFSVRESALYTTKCDLLISVSSGITVAASCWGANPVPILQYCGSETCGTRLLARGPFEMITADDKPLDASKEEFFVVLNNMLNQYK